MRIDGGMDGRRWWLSLLLIVVTGAPGKVAAQEPEAPPPSAEAGPTEPTTEQDGHMLDELLESPAPASDGGDPPAEREATQAAEPAAADAPLETIPVAPLRADEEASGLKQPRSKRVIEEIVVTATKREALARELAASVDAYSGDALENMGAQGIADVVNASPGVSLSNDGFTAQRITIRGISSDLGTNLTVGTFLGDIPFSEPYIPRISLDPNPFDLASVEILKGPQGTLFGGSALNGAIRYIPRAPEFGVVEGKYFVQYSKVSEGGGAPVYGAALNLPIAGRDDLALRAMGFRRKAPGYLDSTHPERQEEDVNTLEQSGARAILGWQASERTGVELTWMTQQTETADLPIADNDEGRLENATLVKRSPQSNAYTLVGLALDHAFSAFDLVSESAWIGKDWTGSSDLSRILGGGTGSLYADLKNDSDAWSQELRLVSSGSDRWTWVAGVFGFDYTLHDEYDALLENAALPSGILGPLVGLPLADTIASDDGVIRVSRVVADIKVSELALFGEVTRRFWDRLDASLGLRAFTSKSGGIVELSGPLLLVSTAPSGGRETIEGTIKERGVNPRASLRFEFDEDRAVFVSVAKGFRFGGINQTRSTDGTSPKFFTSDKLWSYELGFRSQWLDRSLLFDVTLLYVDWTDPQVFQRDPVTQINFLSNAGGVESKGVELALQYLPPIDGLSLAFSMAHIDTRLSEPFTTSQGTERQKGDPWTLAPKLQTAASISYARPFFGWDASVGLSHSYSSETYASLEYRESERVFGYGSYDLQFNLANPGARFAPNLALIISNLTDERGIISASQPIPTYHDVGYTTPRTVTLRIGGSF